MFAFIWVGSGEKWLIVRVKKEGVYSHKEQQLELLRQENTRHVLETEKTGVIELELGKPSLYLNMLNCKMNVDLILSDLI